MKPISLSVIAIALCGAKLLSAADVPLAGVTPAPTMTCDVRTFRAVGDGATLDTKALQAAIDKCSVSGGGIVLVAGAAT